MVIEFCSFDSNEYRSSQFTFKNKMVITIEHALKLFVDLKSLYLPNQK